MEQLNEQIIVAKEYFCFNFRFFQLIELLILETKGRWRGLHIFQKLKTKYINKSLFFSCCKVAKKG
jgi:hypothetical protein